MSVPVSFPSFVLLKTHFHSIVWFLYPYSQPLGPCPMHPGGRPGGTPQSPHPPLNITPHTRPFNIFTSYSYIHPS